MPFHTCFIGVAAFLQASIVEFTTEIEDPIQVVCRGFVGRDAILVGFDAHGCRFLVRWETDKHSPVSHLLPALFFYASCKTVIRSFANDACKEPKTATENKYPHLQI